METPALSHLLFICGTGLSATQTIRGVQSARQEHDQQLIMYRDSHPVPAAGPMITGYWPRTFPRRLWLLRS